MVSRIILVSGPISSGKSTLANALSKRFNMTIIKTRDLIASRSRRRQLQGRPAFQEEGDRLDRTTRGRWVLEGLTTALRDHPDSESVIVDSVRIPQQIEAIRRGYGSIVVHVHVSAPRDVLGERYLERRATGDPETYEEVRANETERQVDALATTADIVMDTNLCTREDVLVRTASMLGCYAKRDSGYVDIIIGGQYGSEGKGQIAAHLAPDYDLLVRVGGPNAGHSV